jgi:hypothetical protein
VRALAVKKETIMARLGKLLGIVATASATAACAPGAEDPGDMGGSCPTWFADLDGDGHGEFGSSIQSCEVPFGYVQSGADCDDSSALVHPDQPEVCDRIDNDCDGRIERSCAAQCTLITEALSRHLYLFCGEGMSRDAAQVHCESQGFTLAEVSSDDENQFLAVFAARSFGPASFFLGASDHAVEGRWTWGADVSLEYTAWAPEQPDNNGDEDCLVVVGSGSQAGRWVDWPCGITAPFVCEQDL